VKVVGESRLPEYESLIHPLTIISTLPSAGVGALLAMVLFKSSLDIVGMVGIILLIGIFPDSCRRLLDRDHVPLGGPSPSRHSEQINRCSSSGASSASNRVMPSRHPAPPQNKPASAEPVSPGWNRPQTRNDDIRRHRQRTMKLREMRAE
jgi:hypothetical protein